MACDPFHDLSVQASKLVTRDAGSLRLVDSTGLSPNVGLLQVRTSNGQYGSVCGMNLAAADVVCKQLGYDFGSVGSACGGYGGSSLCGDAGMPVAMKGLTCEGGEMHAQDCSFSPPDATCSDHSRDAVVYCGTDGQAGIIKDGALRIMSHDGSPSIDGEGRLEMFKASSWAPVCSITAGAEVVACKSMGFAGVKSSLIGTKCDGFKGKDFCGTAAPYVSKLACAGQEGSIESCSFEEGDDVFCAPQESAIVSCAGDGHSQGPAPAAPIA